MHSFYSEIFSISTNIPYLFEMIIENNADTEMMEELSRDISKRIRDDYESIQIINKGGHISNTKIYPAFVFTFYVADNKLSYYMGGMNYQRGYFSQFGENKFESATLKIPDISYSEFAIETIRNELSKYYDIRLDYNLYIIIEYTDIFQENHRGLYLIEDDKTQLP